MSDNAASTGVKIIYSVPASAPRVVFIPILRLWMLAGLLGLLMLWSGVSAWLLFARFDLDLQNLSQLFTGEAVSAETPDVRLPEADAPRAPAAAMVPDSGTVPLAADAPPAITQVNASTPATDLVLPEGQISPLGGAGIELDLLQLKWNGEAAQVSFAVINVADKLLSGRIYARAVFERTDGTSENIVVRTFPAGLSALHGDAETPDLAALADGLSYSTRRRVMKSIDFDMSGESAMTSLDLYFVGDDGDLQARFRFP